MPFPRKGVNLVAIGIGNAARKKDVDHKHGSACSPVTVTVFKTGGRRVYPSSVGSTPTRFRHFSTTFPNERWVLDR